MKEKWFYYLHQEGNVIARVNSDAFEWRMDEFGFKQVSYAKYLKARKEIRESERQENVKRIMEDHDGDDK